MKTALVAGATGLVGGHLVRLLLEDPTFERVTTLVRKKTALTSPKLREVVVDFDRLDAAGSALAADVVFCALGTTIKKAGSQEAFKKVDHDYPLALARATLAAGARRFVIVTAVGADATSGIFYNRVKGELEDALRDLPFPGGLAIAHPSLILGERSERRAAERVGQAVMRGTGFLMRGALRKYKGIDAADVARAMLRAGKGERAGVTVLEGQSLVEAAGAA